MGVYLRGLADEKRLKELKASDAIKTVYLGVNKDSVTIIPGHGDLVDVDEVSHEVWDQFCCECDKYDKYDEEKWCAPCDISRVQRILAGFPVVIPAERSGDE